MAGLTAHIELSLGSVLGHEKAVERLRRQLQAGSVGHAYWITGPPRVGKTTMALGLAGELLGAQGWPGGLLAHPDLWLDDESGNLPVDRIRGGGEEKGEGPSLQHFLSLLAFAGRAKVAIIANAERMTLPASNSLLRMLEEPPPRSVICLTTSRPESERLPSTLRSRCQELHLGPVDAAEVGAWLQSRTGCSEGAAEVAAAICQGRPGLALELVADPDLEERGAAAVRRLVEGPAGGPGSWLSLSRELAERGRDREQAVFTMRSWAAFLRDCCCLAVGASGLLTLPRWQSEARQWAEALGAPGCLRRYDLALDALARLDESATARLVLDRFLLLAFGGSPPTPPAVGAR
ncbi:MAG: DNA polymerase III subunit [Candidatus Dormibacteria bacterium]